MIRKLILGLGCVAVIWSLAMPVTDVLLPNNNGSIIFTWNAETESSHTNIPATTSRTLAIASGALLAAFVFPRNQN